MNKLRNNLIFKILVVTACTAAFEIKKICFFATQCSCGCPVILTMEIDNFPEQFS
jgi:hypothetical protein